MHWLLTSSGVSPLETLPHALLLGYSVYTSFLGDVKPQWLQCHLVRLAQHAQAMDIPLSHPLESLMQPILECLTPGKAYRLALTPVIQGFPELLGRPQSSFLILSERSFIPAGHTPVRLKSVVQSRPLARIKHGSVMETITQRKTALKEGFDDLLWVNPDETLSEASTSNIFFIQGDTLFTPDPERDACLDGITRHQILSHLPATGLTHSGKPIPYQALSTMEGVFITNAISGIQLVSRIDQWVFPNPAKVLQQIDLLRSTLNR